MEQQEKRKMRVQVLEALYQMEFQEKPLLPGSYHKTVVHISQSIQSQKMVIDQILTRHSQNWKIHRMALLDLNILRLAVYEIFFTSPKQSPKIFINEAIELAKLYGSCDSFKFVNGILDSVIQSENAETIAKLNIPTPSQKPLQSKQAPSDNV